MCGLITRQRNHYDGQARAVIVTVTSWSQLSVYISFCGCIGTLQFFFPMAPSGYQFSTRLELVCRLSIAVDWLQREFITPKLTSQIEFEANGRAHAVLGNCTCEQLSTETNPLTPQPLLRTVQRLVVFCVNKPFTETWHLLWWDVSFFFCLLTLYPSLSLWIYHSVFINCYWPQWNAEKGKLNRRFACGFKSSYRRVSM